MSGSGDPVTIAYFYRTRWGAHDEFVGLFDRNHWPILRDQLAEGRFLDVTVSNPRFHGDGRADWDFLVTITYRDWAAIQTHSEAEIARRLFPDQATFKAEEQRRFSLLEAHWDVVLEPHHLPAGDVRTA
jgi:hypothetical protein